MKPLAIFWLSVVWAIVGCRGGLHVSTDTTVRPVLPVAGPVHASYVEAGAAETRIALVDVDGLLLNMDMAGPYAAGDNPVAVFRERLDAVACDGCVKAVVVRINSPGGGVTASDIMRHDLLAFKARTRLPVIVCVMDVGAGGAYYLATAGDQIIAHPTSVVGGIGVILNIYNLADAMAQFNVVASPVKAGEHIDLGSPIKGLTEEKRRLLQEMCNTFHERFREAVLTTRRAPPESRPVVFDGRVFTAGQALQFGLVDSIGYLDDAINVARQVGGAPQASVAMYHRANDPAHSQYAVTANVPLQTGLLPLSLPGLDRARMPTFLYLWQPEPTLEKLGGR